MENLSEVRIAAGAIRRSGGLAYWALRTRSIRRRRLTEKIADVIFLVALTLMTIVCALITYTLV